MQHIGDWHTKLADLLDCRGDLLDALVEVRQQELFRRMAPVLSLEKVTGTSLPPGAMTTEIQSLAGQVHAAAGRIRQGQKLAVGQVPLDIEFSRWYQSITLELSDVG